MLRTLARRAKAQAIRQPAIRFPDRKAPHQKSEPHPHPAAPTEIAEHFSDFLKTFESGPHFDAEKLHPFSVASESTPVGTGMGKGKGDGGGQERTSSSPASSSKEASESGKGKGPVVEDLHDLPSRFWKTATLVIDEVEMEAVMSGGATLSQRP